MPRQKWSSVELVKYNSRPSEGERCLFMALKNRSTYELLSCVIFVLNSFLIFNSLYIINACLSPFIFVTP